MYIYIFIYIFIYIYGDDPGRAAWRERMAASCFSTSIRSCDASS